MYFTLCTLNSLRLLPDFTLEIYAEFLRFLPIAGLHFTLFTGALQSGYAVVKTVQSLCSRLLVRPLQIAYDLIGPHIRPQQSHSGRNSVNNVQ